LLEQNTLRCFDIRTEAIIGLYVELAIFRVRVREIKRREDKSSRQPVVEMTKWKKSVSKSCKRLANAIAVPGSTGRQGRQETSSRIASRFCKEGLAKETALIRIGIVRNMAHTSFQIRKVTNDFIV